MAPDHPLIRIELSGVRGTGKSILAAHFRRLLADMGVIVHGPSELPQRSFRDLAIAIDSLKARGLFVEFVETKTAEAPPIDARYRRGEIAA